MLVDTRLAAYLVWGVGTLIVYSIVLVRRRRAYLLHHDARSRRDFIEGLALFMTSMASALAIAFVLFGEAGTGLRGLFAAIALGMFSTAGLVMATEKQPVEK